MTRTDLPALTVGWIGTGPDGRRAGRAHRPARAWTSRSGTAPAAKAEPLVDAGAKVADEPVELADRDVVFTMVSTSADLEQVRRRGRPADRPGARRRGIVVDCSTVSTEASARGARGARRAGHRLPRRAGQRQRQGGRGRQAQPGRAPARGRPTTRWRRCSTISARRVDLRRRGRGGPAGEDLPQRHARRGHPVPGRDHRAGREGRGARARRSSTSSTTA